MAEPIEITDEELHAYVDGELTPERRRCVELRMVEDPALRARASTLRMLHYFIVAAYRELPLLANSVAKTST